MLVWQRSRALAIDVYRFTGAAAFQQEWGLKGQLRRAAVSVPSNIAEGWARGYERESARFFVIARGSLAEVSTQADIAAAVGLLEASTAEAVQLECQELSAMLSRLIEVRSRRGIAGPDR